MGFGNVSSQKSDQQTQVRDFKVTGGDDSVNMGGEGNTNIITDASPLALATVENVVKAAFGNQLGNRDADRVVLDRFADLAETKVTDGASGAQKTVLVALAIGGAVLVLPSLLKR